MNQLNIPFSPHLATISAASTLLDTLKKHAINIAPWASYSYKPDVSFSITYGAESIFIKYYVFEQSLRAIYRNINDPVFNDTCVEFFIAFNGDENYYNLEFNCMGTCHAGYGDGRIKRTNLPEKVVSRIACQPVFKPQATAELVNWELTLSIPFATFRYHDITSLQNTSCRVNFYKCGDQLPVPHYLTWNAVRSDEPDFHLPQFFGEAYFMKSTDQ
ncbi:MAG: carbohydrate-binding family 9-like protein [Bacteroidota bacterium]